MATELLTGKVEESKLKELLAEALKLNRETDRLVVMARMFSAKRRPPQEVLDACKCRNQIYLGSTEFDGEEYETKVCDECFKSYTI